MSGKLEELERRQTQSLTYLEEKVEHKRKELEVELEIIQLLKGIAELPTPEIVHSHAYPKECFGSVKWNVPDFQELDRLLGLLPAEPLKMIKGTFCSFVPEVSSADGGAQTLVEGTIFNFEQDYRRSYAAWDKVGTTCLAHWFTRIGDRLLGIDVAVHEHGMHIEPDHTTERKRIVRHRWSLCRNGILRFSGAQKITWAPSKSNEPGRFTLYWKGQ